MPRQTPEDFVLSPAQAALLTPRVRWYTKLLARRIALRCNLPSAEREELIGIGLLNLPQIASRFDPQCEVKFITFATYRLRGCMLDYLRRTINYGFRAKNWSYPVPIAESQRLERVFYGTQGLKNPGNSDLVSGDAADRLTQGLLNQYRPDIYVEQKLLIEQICRALTGLSPTEQTVVTLHYFEHLTLEEVGARMNLSKSWVCRLRQQALAQLRAALLSNDTP